MYILEKVLIRLVADLEALRVSWALVGGLAVAVHGEPRTTRDVDVVLAAAEESAAEAAVLGLRMQGYRDYPGGAVIEQKDGRLATVRLISPLQDEGGIVVDLLFSSSGVEPEIVAQAKWIELMPKFVVPVIRAGHLLAVKIHAGRPKDLEDARTILESLHPSELQIARETLKLIHERGFSQEKDLQAELDNMIRSRDANRQLQ